MSEVFDAYYKWLGIPPEEQPPHYYRLLGLRPFEADPDVIASAADQRMAHLRSFQGGRHGPRSQEILNEVAAARVALLNAAKKTEYDRKLYQYLALRQQQVLAQQQALAAQQAAAAPAAPPPQPPAMVSGYQPLSAPAAPDAASDSPLRDIPLTPHKRPAPQSGLATALMSAAVVVGVGGVAGFLILSQRPSQTPLADAGRTVGAGVTAAPHDKAAATSNAAPINNAVPPAKPAAVAAAGPAAAPPPAVNSAAVPAKVSETPATPPAAAPPAPATETPPMDKPPGDDAHRPATAAAASKPEGGRLSVPDAAARAQAEERLKESLRGASLERVLTVADEERPDPAARYMLLNKARHMAMEAGDVPQALTAQRDMLREFAGDGLALKIDTFSQLCRTGSGSDYRGLAQEGLTIVDEALEDGRKEQALRCVSLALAAARKAHDKDLIRKATLSALLLQNP